MTERRDGAEGLDRIRQRFIEYRTRKKIVVSLFLFYGQLHLEG